MPVIAAAVGDDGRSRTQRVIDARRPGDANVREFGYDPEATFPRSTRTKEAVLSLESIAPEFFTAPKTKIDGIPAAITSDLGIYNDLSDRGTGIGFDRPWTQAQIDSVAERAAVLVAATRVTR